MTNQAINVMYVTGLVRQAYRDLSSGSDQVQQLKASLSPYDFVREFGTIRIQLPRRSGVSTAALCLLEEYSNSVLVYKTHAEMKYQLGQEQWKHLRSNSDIVALTQPVAKLGQQLILRQCDPVNQSYVQRDLMIFDGASRMKQDDINELIVWCCNHTKLFVLLG
jgi:hypothetical protein